MTSDKNVRELHITLVTVQTCISGRGPDRTTAHYLLENFKAIHKRSSF